MLSKCICVYLAVICIQEMSNAHVSVSFCLSTTEQVIPVGKIHIYFEAKQLSVCF